MLNISDKRIKGKVEASRMQSLNRSSTDRYIRLAGKTFVLTIISMVLIGFVPWTQNVRGTGRVTTLRPEQRPQTLQSPIPGQVSRWFVREGDTVRQGDTLVFISEVKDEYFDPSLAGRLEQQIDAKAQSVTAYDRKVEALNAQLEALRKARTLKIRQLRLQVESDSIDLRAAEVARGLADIQLQRADSLFREGIRSRFDYEQRLQRWQDAVAKETSARNKWMKSRADLVLILAEFDEKLAKTESDRMSALSAGLEAEVDLVQTRVKASNLRVRQGYYYVRAPQDGLVSRTLLAGLGETIKEGQPLLELMPLHYDLAVEIFVRPVDLPLMRLGQNARVEFDGWPALVFSGWPNASFGTFGAEVVAIENVLDASGRYRLLLKPDTDENPWPEGLRFGSAVNGMILLKDVPVWYEIWRQINGFPPEYYIQTPTSGEKK